MIIWTERFFPEIGGLEGSMFRLYSAMRKRGMEVLVLTCSGFYADERNADIHYFPPKTFLRESVDFISKSSPTLKCLYIARVLQNDIRRHLDAIAKLPDIPAVVLRSPTTSHIRQVCRIDRERTVERKVTTIITLNEESRRICRRLYPGKTILRVSNSVILPTIYRTEYNSYFLFSGRITPSKNLHTLLRAWRIWKESSSRTNSVLRIYGPPYEESYFESCMRTLEQTPDARYCGTYAPGDTAVIDSASFLVIPSFREGHSNVMNEAFACGTPVISADIPGLSDHNSFEKGLVVGKPSDAAEIADAISYANQIGASDYLNLCSLVRHYAEEELSANPEADYLTDLVERTQL